MLRYILRRLLQAVPVFLGTTFLIYFMVFAMPGNPIVALFGDKTPNPAQVAALEAQYNLDQPFFMQYLLYLKNVFTGDLGTTFSGRDVNTVLADTFPVTLKLVLMAVVLEFFFAVVIGLISGLREGKFFDNASVVLALIFNSLPVFVGMFLAQYFVGIKWGWAPVTVGRDTSWGAMFLPALVIALTIYVTGMRLMRGSVIESRSEDYVRTAYAKGLTSRRIIPVHIARNSLIPVVTNTAASFGALIAGTTITEGIFNIPGVGNTLYQAIIRGENSTVVSFVTVLTLLYVIVNILVDLLYAVLDPRIRYV
ncbi:ABC transporter permease [Demequina sp.]|uniref:ABC transporter permease n=1 Tax=Demequina sp. TaxID=2050685 RepID=UPI0025BFA55B|nr:ABC transporter permease [Demequina sp.]